MLELSGASSSPSRLSRRTAPSNSGADRMDAHAAVQWRAAAPHTPSTPLAAPLLEDYMRAQVGRPPPLRQPPNLHTPRRAASRNHEVPQPSPAASQGADGAPPTYVCDSPSHGSINAGSYSMPPPMRSQSGQSDDGTDSGEAPPQMKVADMTLEKLLQLQLQRPASSVAGFDGKPAPRSRAGSVSGPASAAQSVSPQERSLLSHQIQRMVASGGQGSIPGSVGIAPTPSPFSAVFPSTSPQPPSGVPIDIPAASAASAGIGGGAFGTPSMGAHVPPPSTSPPLPSPSPPPPSARFWVQISGVTSTPACQAALEQLGKAYRIHPVTIADLVDARPDISREKLEVFADYVFLVLHAVQHPTPTIFDIVHGEGGRDHVAQHHHENGMHDEQLPQTTYNDGGDSNPFEQPHDIQASSALPTSASFSAFATSASSNVMSASPRARAAAVAAGAREAGASSYARGVATGVFHAARVLTTPIQIVVMPHLVISFHPAGAHQGELNSVVRKLHALSETRMEGGQWIVHAMMDGIVNSLMPIVAAADHEVDMLEELIFAPRTAHEHDGGSLLHRLALTRRRLLMLQQQLKSKGGIINTLLQRSGSSVSSSGAAAAANLAQPYLRDLGDHVVNMLTTCDGAATMLEALQNAYLSQLQLRAEMQSRDLNDNMKKLSAFATVFLPLSLISGIMGMNVEVPSQVWERSEDGPSFETQTPFWTLILVMVGIATTMLWVMRRKGFL